MNKAFFLTTNICICIVGNIYADLAQEIHEKVESSTRSDSNYQLRLVAKLSSPASSQNGQIQRIETFGSILLVENTYSGVSTDATPYVRRVEQYLTNGFKTFREGGVLSSGNKVANEAELFSSERPVIGLALFASKFFQARLLELMNNPNAGEVVTDEGPCYVVSGQVKFGEIPLNVRLRMSKTDCLLLELDSWIVTNSHTKLIATRGESKGGDWPYSRISSEVWAQDQLLSKRDIQISIERAPIGSSDDSLQLKIPVGTTVTDKRFGYGVVYKTRKDGLGDEKIDQMSTDPDFRTNKYFMSHFQILSTTSPSTPIGPKRFIIFGIVLATGLAPLAILWRRRSRRHAV